MENYILHFTLAVLISTLDGKVLDLAKTSSFSAPTSSARPTRLNLRSRGIGVVHGSQTNNAFDALAGKLLAQQLKGIDLDHSLTVEVLNLVAFGPGIAIYAGLLDTMQDRS